MKVADLGDVTTSRLRSLGDLNPIQLAADAFLDRRVGLIVICDEQRHARGVVSKSDLVRHLAAGGSVRASLAKVMTTSVISAALADDLMETWERMVSQRLQNLPVLDEQARVVGTLDVRDALLAILQLERNQEVQLINYIAGVGYR
jgi:CBS domain-containing protein